MKKFSKILSVALLVALVLSLGVANAFAATQTVANSPADDDNATVTINNPAKGETYNLFKLFDATVGEGGTISYQCTGAIPTQVASFFSKDDSNNVIPADSILEKDDNGKVTGSKMTNELKAALEAWATAQANPDATAESTGEEALAFTGMPYGYYVVTTTHKPDGENAKAAITVTSTKPTASIYDKNTNEPSAKKEVEKQTYSIGDTVKYTATFDTTNYMGEGANAKQVVDYIIKDTLPPYLSNAVVTSVTIGGTAYTVEDDNGTAGPPQFDANKQIIIPWATKDTSVTPAKFTSIYDQGSQIVIQYQAVLTSTTNINANDKNVVSITPEVDNDNGDKKPWDETWEDHAEIVTYAAAIHKVDDKNADLAGAQFTVAGLVVETVKAADGVTVIPGVYRVVSYTPSSTTASAVMDTDDNGMLYILGLASNVELTVTEYKAPDGYNKLTETKTLVPQDLKKSVWYETGERHFDADGNLVSETVTGGSTTTVTRNLEDLKPAALTIQNNKGVELPSTGGIGTTIFYVVGGVLVLAAIILLVTKKRMSE